MTAEFSRLESAPAKEESEMATRIMSNEGPTQFVFVELLAYELILEK